MTNSYKQAPYRAVRFGPRDTIIEHRSDGSMLLRSPHALGAF